MEATIKFIIFNICLIVVVGCIFTNKMDHATFMLVAALYFRQ